MESLLDLQAHARHYAIPFLPIFSVSSPEQP